MKNYEHPDFIPPWHDVASMCAHLCISESTIDNWIRQSILPPAKMVGGKRMWKWAEVSAFIDGDASIVPDDLNRRITNATKAAASR